MLEEGPAEELGLAAGFEGWLEVTGAAPVPQAVRRRVRSRVGTDFIGSGSLVEGTGLEGQQARSCAAPRMTRDICAVAGGMRRGRRCFHDAHQASCRRALDVRAATLQPTYGGPEPMTDFLGRDQSPLTEEQWKTFDEVVVQIARQSLVGRRMLNVYGPIGPDQQVVPNDRYQHPTEGEVNFTGETDDAEIRPSGRRYMALPILHKDFTIHWRDLVEAQRSGMPMDTGPVASAAAYCARLEDELIF